jgi:ABC-type transporter Mla subunit MlaD
VLTSIQPHLLLTGSLLLLLLGAFLWFFVRPSMLLRRRLHHLAEQLKSSSAEKRANPELIESLFMQDKHFAHLWNEYRKTLYDALPSTDGVTVPIWRSTVPAESFWSGPFVVDGRVNSDFFKHLPGIFTGLGIIGTFIGLIEGLKRFKVDSNADVVRQGLESLMHAVGEAFTVSAAAIGLAMVATLVEKLLLNRLYATVEEIADILDKSFSTTAGEKYLEQTAAHTEESATQLKHLKGELLKDLKPILSELSQTHVQTMERLATLFQERIAESAQHQIQANRENSTTIATSISEAISNGLSGPLDEIKDAVKQASGDQSAKAITMLQDVMSSFSQKLNDLFGGQISGINELNRQTAQTMQDAVGKLNELVASLQDAGRSSSEAMAEQMAKALSDMEARQQAITQSTQALVAELRVAIEQAQVTTADGVKSSTDEMSRRMAEAIEKMEQRQDSINERTREFVEQIKALTANSQTETNSKLVETLDLLGQRVGGLLNEMQGAHNATLEASRVREEGTVRRTEEAIGTIAGQTKDFVGEVGDLLDRSRTQTDEHVAKTFGSVNEQFSRMLDLFQEKQRDALDKSQLREEQNSSRTQQAVDALVGAVDGVTKQLADAANRMQQCMSELTNTTTTAVTRLNDGAEQVNTATRNFAAAGDKVSSVVTQVASTSSSLTSVSSDMTTVSSALQAGIRDYGAQREALSQLIPELRTLVDSAKHDVSMTSDVLRRIEDASRQLGNAQVQADEFLRGVATVLAEAHEQVRTSVTTSLNKSNHEFQKKLSDAVGLLGGSIKELEDVLQFAGTRSAQR